MMNGFTTEPAAWTERYETLRCYVLEGRALLQAQPLGLVLWMAKGMAGWMREWSKLSRPEPHSPATVWLARWRRHSGLGKLSARSEMLV